MSFSIELKCDKRLGTKGRVCLSDTQDDSPKRMFGNTLAEVKAGIGELVIQATTKGWRKRDGAWTCPHCQ